MDKADDSENGRAVHTVCSRIGRDLYNIAMHLQESPGEERLMWRKETDDA